MNTGNLNDLIELLETCGQLRNRLAEARVEATDEQWDAIIDGPFGEILSAAIDVEDLIETSFDV